MIKYSLLLAFLFFALTSFSAEPPLIRLDDLSLSGQQYNNLQESIIANAPSVIIVIDPVNKRSSIFVTGQPARLDVSEYVLVDILDTVASSESIRSEIRNKAIQIVGENPLATSIVITEDKGANNFVPSSKEWADYFSLSSSYRERWQRFQHRIVSSTISYKEEPKIKLDFISAEINLESILIDSRRPIAGNGDTASVIYLVQNLMRRGFQNKVDILVDEKSSRILRALSKNLPGFSKAVNLITESELSEKVYTLVIRSGLPSGRVFVESLRMTSKSALAQLRKVNISKQTIFLSTTIYGNSKNKASVQPLSLIGQDNKFYLLPATGLDISRDSENKVNTENKQIELNFSEAGIFRDPFSLSIRNWSIETIEKFLIKQATIHSPDLAKLIQEVIQLRTQNVARYSLAYGFSIPQVRKQARDYFRSLLASPYSSVVLTPSAFNRDLLESFTEAEQKDIHLISLNEFVESGYQVSRKHLTVIQIPNVPHHIFSALLLASNRNGVVPLGAGDGFFTTALSLGIPFAPTIVEWNIRNVRALSRILQIEAFRQNFSFMSLQHLRRVFSAIPSDPIELVHSQQLLRYDSIFRSSIEQIPDLTNTIDHAIMHIRGTRPLPKGMSPVETMPNLFTGTADQQSEKMNKYQNQEIVKCEKLFL